MRKIFLGIAITLAATAAMAQTQVSVFTSNLGYAWTHDYSERTGGLGVALSHALGPHWSLELKVADERHDAMFAVFPGSSGGDFTPRFERRSFHAIPVDLLTEYRFANSSRWTPYVSGGVRYVSARRVAAFVTNDANGMQQIDTRSYGNRTSGEVGVGADLRISRHVGMRFDANVLLRSQDVFYDRLFRPSIGVNWRF